MDLQASLARPFRMQHRGQVALDGFPQEHGRFQVELEDVGVHVPAPVVPPVERPTELAAAVAQEYLTQKLADRPIVVVAPVFALGEFHTRLSDYLTPRATVKLTGYRFLA